eukprot:comp62400_c0_seq1/m.47920 comp62400_c0_seq1/g.47920  ORF comp62400_c0_seq1/g.47920 comp62400_c0_seq1/m.47920 type:complete len:932 (-) comp62400_c0_seq1:257-3052(-)
MGKTYLRYSPSGAVGLVVGTGSNTLSWGKDGEYAIAGALENIIIWDLRKGTALRTLPGEKHEVTCMASSPDGTHLAAGYNDGSIRLWNLLDGTCNVTLSGHKAAVTALAYDQKGLLLCSGSKDCDVIVWDVVAEAGLYRLRGHKDQVTCVRFMHSHKLLITSSKDTFVKVWDLDIQHCVQTLVGHRSEVWGFVVNPDETRMICGTVDEDLKLWAIGPAKENGEEGQNGTTSAPTSPLDFTLLGSVPRKGKERVVTLRLHANGKYLLCQGADKIVEVYSMRSEEEILKRVKRRAKRQREKKSSHAGDTPAEHEEPEATRNASDEIEHLHNVPFSAKARSVDWGVKVKTVKGHSESEEVQFIAALNNNTLELHSITVGAKSTESAIQSGIELPGHRSGVRAMAVSDDDKLLVSACSGLVKVWNVSTRNCIRTLPVSYALSVAFVPGNRHVLVGTKGGDIHLFDIGGASLVQTTKAHEGAVWALALRPDRRGFASGSADKEVKFWDFDLVDDPEYSKTAKRLGYAHSATLKMSDDVLAVKYSPDMKLVAVSLLDCTVKIFFADSLKFFTSLYGHKLPVLAMDISADSTLIVTASADKNIKFWGLDFGDCHKSIFAHTDSIMGVSFVADTHYVFTVSKDRTIKYWDGDSFEHILTLNGHHAEVWCCAVTKYGHSLFTGSHDRSIRVWQRTDEQVILEEEREAQREAENEGELTKENPYEKGTTDDGVEAVAATKRTIESIKGAEAIIEAIELADQETATYEQWERECAEAKRIAAATHSEPSLPPPPQRNIILSYLKMDSPERYVLHVVGRVHPNELEESLMVLPFNTAMRLLHYLNSWLSHGWETELACRCLLSLLHIHHNQLVTSSTMLPILDALKGATHARVASWKDTVGFNLAGLQHLQRELQGTQVKFFEDARQAVQEKARKKKRKVLVS